MEAEQNGTHSTTAANGHHFAVMASFFLRNVAANSFNMTICLA